MADDMWMVAGLGNPGRRYHDTRHNMGFLALDELHRSLSSSSWRCDDECELSEARVADSKVILVKPMSFMNLSGRPIAALARFRKVMCDRLIVMHDDLDIPAGALRIRQGGGDGGHNGIRSVVQELGGVQFYRVRIGIGRPVVGDVISWVLSSVAEKQEQEVLSDAVVAAASAVPVLIELGLSAAQNRFNRQGLQKAASDGGQKIDS